MSDRDAICWLVLNCSSLTVWALRGAGALRRMLSRLSFRSAPNSGCLNSHAYSRQSENCCWGVFRKGLEHTEAPYGDCPLSSLCLTLWKSYLFSCRTKLAKLLCLKCFGSIAFVNFSFCRQIVSM